MRDAVPTRAAQPVSDPAPGPQRLDASRFDPANRRRISAPALRTFLAIADLWGLRESSVVSSSVIPPARPIITGVVRPGRTEASPWMPMCSPGFRRCSAFTRPLAFCLGRARRRRVAPRPAPGFGLRRAGADRAGHERIAGRAFDRAALPRWRTWRSLYAAQCHRRGFAALRGVGDRLSVTDVLAPAPHPAHRLVPSRFPPIGLFDTVATAADLIAVMELVGWTNDRLIAERVARLPREEWVAAFQTPAS